MREETTKASKQEKDTTMETYAINNLLQILNGSIKLEHINYKVKETTYYYFYKEIKLNNGKITEVSKIKKFGKFAVTHTL